jgi:hypothetical protein
LETIHLNLAANTASYDGKHVTFNRRYEAAFLACLALQKANVPNTAVESETSAYLRVYIRGEKGLRQIGAVEMYKAKLAIANSESGYDLIIRGDYGHDEPVVVHFDTRDQLQRLLSLTHREGLFSLVDPPSVPFA